METQSLSPTRPPDPRLSWKFACSPELKAAPSAALSHPACPALPPVTAPQRSSMKHCPPRALCPPRLPRFLHPCPLPSPGPACPCLCPHVQPGGRTWRGGVGAGRSSPAGALLLCPAPSPTVPALSGLIPAFSPPTQPCSHHCTAS